MKLPRPASPFERIEHHGESFTLDTSGKILVLPSGNPDILPSHNEYTLNSNRLSIAESPFGGLKGSGSPDYAPGTVNIIEGDGVYLQDVNGQNSSKTLSAGKLKELNLMSVDTVNHSITEEFIVANTSESNNPTVISDGSSTTNWKKLGEGGASGSLSSDGSTVALTTITSGTKIYLILTSEVSLTNQYFIPIRIKGPAGKTGNCYLFTSPSNFRRYDIIYNGEWQIFVLPKNKPTLSIGNPTDTLTSLRFDLLSPVAGDILEIDYVSTDTAKSATIEAQIPDNLSATSLSLYTHNGTAYQLCSTHSLDGAYSQVSQTSANCTFLDGTKLDDVYGTGAGRAVFPKSSAGTTVNGSTGSITYSENLGTDKRIGLKFNLPPSDNGRTNFNKVQAKLVINYAPDAENVYSATHIFADSTNTSYGLQNLSKPWIALYDPTSNLIDFYLFTHRPKNLEFRRDESGNIYELVLYPGNGLIYHGQITYPDLTLDSDSNLIPNFLEESIEGSLTKFLKSYGMVI